ncbi:MAG TPA: NAD(P)-dependent oxidoreductase, partial [Alphaproteobacteria bacterium]|nr:NAD(P)-dependent oxidoreductase [Alphaproteobacteria bacterium]
HHDVVDAEFEAAFPDVRFVKVPDSGACAAELGDAEILTITSQFYDAKIAEALRQPASPVKWIQFATTGFDAASRVGLPDDVLITNVRGIRSGILAGHAIALMLGVMRGFHTFTPYRLQHDWARAEMQQGLISTGGATAVICGMGGVGRDIARKAKVFDMNVIGVSRRGRAGGDFDRVVPRDEIGEVLPEADVLFLAQGYGPDVHHYIGKDELALMKTDAIVVNIGRGALTDEAALAEALKAGRLKGAGIDVYSEEPLGPDSPFWDLENVVMTPHIAGQGGTDQKARLRALFLDNMTRYLAGRPLLNRVTVDGDVILDEEDA